MNRMRVLVMVPVYSAHPPTGAFATTRDYTQALARRGHTVHVVTTVDSYQGVRVCDDGGVTVWPLHQWAHALAAADPGLVVSHHTDRRSAFINRVTAGVPRLLMVHGMHGDRRLGCPAMVWFPSRACQQHYGYRGRSLVSAPPINPDLYATVPGDQIVLSGSTVAKGADVLAAVAARMPTQRFTVVRSGGRDQVPLTGLRNVTVIDRVPALDLYGRARVVLMPSTTETYGRVGVEAACSGIPVIAAPLPGIREALGDAAVYVPRTDVLGWVRELQRLADPVRWAHASETASAHAANLDHAGVLAAFEQACQAVCRIRRPVGG